MIKNCAVLDCKNTDDEFLTFYSLPYKDKELCQEWIKRVANPEICMQNEDKPALIHRICEIHFHYSCKTGLNSQLHPNSLPTLCLPFGTTIKWTNCFLERLDVKDVQEEAEIVQEVNKKKKMNLELEDCSDICRVCYSKGILYNINNSKYKNQFISTILQRLIKKKSAKLETFPISMCIYCIKLLLMSDLFMKRVKESNLRFNSLAAVKKITIKKNLAKKSKRSLLVSYITKLDFKTILSDCDLKIKKNKCTNALENNLLEIKKILELEKLNREKKYLKASETKFNREIDEKPSEINESINFSNINDGDKLTNDIYIETDSKFDGIDLKTGIEIIEENAVYRCFSCNSFFSTKKSLRQHKNTKHQLFCVICGKICKSRKMLQKHVEFHTEINIFECRICLKKYKGIKSLAKHINSHDLNYCNLLTNKESDKGKLCAICGKVVTYSMKQHMLQHASKNRKCQFCTYTTYCKSVLKRHEEAHRGAKLFLCTQCGRAYASKMSLNDHTKDHEPLPKPLQCLYCEELFNTKYDRQIHAQRHGVNLRAMSKPKLYPKEKASACPQCGMQFAFDTQLQVHLKNVHNVVDADCFPCPYCTETFTAGYKRSYHVSRQHRQKEKSKKLPAVRSKALPRFVCDLCQKPEMTKSSLRVHMRVHTGERPYRCDQCASAFKQQQQLKNHKQRVHKKERPFPCKLCDRAFNTGQELGEHARTHTGETVQCEHCEKKFKQRSNRSKHMREVHNIRMRGKYSRDKKAEDAVVE